MPTVLVTGPNVSGGALNSTQSNPIQWYAELTSGQNHH